MSGGRTDNYALAGRMLARAEGGESGPFGLAYIAAMAVVAAFRLAGALDKIASSLETHEPAGRS